MSTSRNASLLARPLSARSVMLSLLLGMDPPRLRGALLVQWAGLFGVAGGTARVALSRMAAAGELRTAAGVYELGDRLAARREAQEWALAPRRRAWRGEWTFAVVEAAPRSAAERQACRAAMARLRCAELREGVWTRPDNLPGAAASPADQAVVDRQCRWWWARPVTDDPVALAAELFHPEAWGTRAVALGESLARVTDALRAGEEGLEADAFVAGAAVVAHLRADPLLPDALLVEPSPGDALRAAYRNYREAFGVATARWFRARRDR